MFLTTKQPKNRWLFIIAITQCLVIATILIQPSDLEGRMNPDSQTFCASQCGGGGCSITVADHQDPGGDGGCIGYSAHECTNSGHPGCSCSCSCGTLLQIEGPEGHTIYSAGYIPSGQGCGTIS
jgi:hypothetical protein